jgi:dTDP-3-amino-3,4,6-trideoxy-alpha-D-glucose transaminase
MISKIKLNDFEKIWDCIKEDCYRTIERVGSSGWYILGKEVLEFEEELIKFYPGTKYTIGCGNGLDAIEIGLKALGIQKGDIVLTTPLSAFATTIAIIKAGGIPAFVDTYENGLINLDLAEQFFKNNPNVKHFIPVHLYGHALDLNRLEYLKNKFNLKIVEDCAQAIGAKSKNISVGTIGQVAATSFYPTKNLGCFGDGGAVLTSDENIAKISRSLRDYGQTSKYHHDVIGINSRLDELQAAIMKDCLLPRLNEFTHHRQLIAEIYNKNIKNEDLTIPPKPKDSESVYHLYPVVIKKDRNAFKEYLKNNNVESGIHYPILIPDQIALKNSTHFIYGSLDTSRNFVEHELSLPINPTMTESDAYEVVKICNNWKA